MCALSATSHAQSETADADGESEFAGDVVGWSALGLGGAMLATSGALSSLKNRAVEDVNTYDKRAPGASPAELAGRKAEADAYYDAAVATAVVGGALVATGAGFVAHHYAYERAEGGVTWRIGARWDTRTAYLGARARF